MKKIIFTILTLLLLAISTDGKAADDWFEWDRNNTLLHVPLTLVLALDMAQTLDIKNHPEFYENNAILGGHPSDEEVYTYFITSFVVISGLVLILPKNWSHGLQTGVIVIEVGVAANNYHMGIGIAF